MRQAGGELRDFFPANPGGRMPSSSVASAGLTLVVPGKVDGGKFEVGSLMVAVNRRPCGSHGDSGISIRKTLTRHFVPPSPTQTRARVLERQLKRQVSSEITSLVLVEEGMLAQSCKHGTQSKHGTKSNETGRRPSPCPLPRRRGRGFQRGRW